jgi:hypothetical protein
MCTSAACCSSCALKVRSLTHTHSHTHTRTHAYTLTCMHTHNRPHTASTLPIPTLHSHAHTYTQSQRHGFRGVVIYGRACPAVWLCVDDRDPDDTRPTVWLQHQELLFRADDVLPRIVASLVNEVVQCVPRACDKRSFVCNRVNCCCASCFRKILTTQCTHRLFPVAYATMCTSIIMQHCLQHHDAGVL